MHQIAWLDFHGGCWHLVTGNAGDPGREWVSRDTALSDLAAEGWVTNGPHGKEPTIKHKADRHFYGYALIRMVH